MKQITCKSGLIGWQCRLQENYANKEEFERYCQIYNLAERLGFDSTEEAWDANPLIEGSVEPTDFRRVNPTAL